jgi:RNA 3'-terminal phosphate cyclase (GTP)
MIEIDGSHLEGGGQIMRTTAAISVATGRACRIFNIRKHRPKPGLATQHLLGLQALTRLCRGRLEGGAPGSMDIRLFPGPIKGGELTVKIPTAGSVTLVLQLLLLPALFADNPVTVVFEGGATDTFYAPTSDHFRFVFLEILGKMGPRIEMEIARRGFYPKGGARVRTRILPCRNLNPLLLTETGSLQGIAISSGAGVLLKARRVAERQTEAALSVLKERRSGDIGIIHDKIEYYDTLNPGSQINIRAEFEHSVLGADQLGRLGKRAEDVGRDAAQQFLGELESGGGACLDSFTADQILPCLALSGREGRVTVSRITDHAKTNMWVIEQLVRGAFEVSGNTIHWRPA